MNEQQWQTLLAVIRGETLRPLPTGFIIDSPWLPNWAGHTILDYFTDERLFLEDNLKAIRAFPRAMFLPGFWSEYGMCTEPSAFGSVSVWEPDEFPFAKKVLRSPAEVDQLEAPNPRKEGLLPFVIQRLRHLQPEIEAAGHQIRFAVARGPLNIATFLMGTTEFLTAIKTDPERMHRLLQIATDYLVDWIAWQRECFPSIDGILLLDDIVGFVSRRDFEIFGLPYLKRAFDTDVSVKFFHNDAPCKACAPLLAGRRHQPPQLRRPAHAQRHAGVDRRQAHAARQPAAPRRPRRRHARGRRARGDRDAGCRRGSLAPHPVLWRGHASGREEREHRGVHRDRRAVTG